MTDRRHGRRDGRAGLSGETGWLRALRKLTTERMNADLLQCESDLAELVDRWTTAAGPVEALRDRVARAEQELAEADKDPDLDWPPRLADARHTVEFARNRRRNAHLARREDAARRHYEAQRALGEVVQLVSMLQREIDQLKEVIAVRRDMVRAHGSRRIACYWQHYARAHRDHAKKAGETPPRDPDLPWDDEGGQRL
ncbi:hypothetical protein BBK82_21735 [Lentzea guizhouensis]|uniref:Uncharacterized protein n=1 Tax=Lentzea guizhouensis TaxID=1586287 RepID=A0A1B2HKP5_9PSEU|nr:hypothetical protein [Lentzea guizhouensis]ANZ38295.1 hypothetical protein BBK82_21735 [Lentzea guizhouensis]